MEQPLPKTVDLLPDGIHILWDDGHQGYHEHRYLRSQCGCANCVSEMTGQRVVFLGDIPSDVEAVEWMQLGHYALQFLWTDFHETGIYPFTILRDLCQCDQCKGAKAK